MTEPSFINQLITPRLDPRFACEPVKAHVCGALAYHHTVMTFGMSSTYTVTHVPTGLALAVCVSTEEKAIEVIRSALDSGIDWSHADYEWYEAHAAGEREVALAKQIRAICGWEANSHA